MSNRTQQELEVLVTQALPHIADRFFAEKNIRHGDYNNIDPFQLYRWIQKEGLESFQAYRNNEGVERVARAWDVMLLCLFRVNDICQNGVICQL